MLAAFGNAKALLRLRFTREVAVVDFQICGGEDDQVRRCLVARALCPRVLSVKPVTSIVEAVLTRRTTSPFTRSAAGTDVIDPSRTTWHEGGIMAKNDARIASDFWSWKNSMKALRKATAIRIPPR